MVAVNIPINFPNGKIKMKSNLIVYILVQTGFEVKLKFEIENQT